MNLAVVVVSAVAGVPAVAVLLFAHPLLPLRFWPPCSCWCLLMFQFFCPLCCCWLFWCRFSNCCWRPFVACFLAVANVPVVADDPARHPLSCFNSEIPTTYYHTSDSKIFLTIDYHTKESFCSTFDQLTKTFFFDAQLCINVRWPKKHLLNAVQHSILLTNRVV